MNLQDTFKAYLDGITDEAAIEFFGVTPATVKRWRGGGAPSLAAVQAVVDALPKGGAEEAPSGGVELAMPGSFAIGYEGAVAVIGTPVVRYENPLTNHCIEAIMQKHAGNVIRDRTVGTYICKARNEIATRFLASGAKYLLFIDDDMVFPCGDADFLNDTCGANLPVGVAKVDLLGRLASHNKGIVSGVYFSRARTGDGVGISHKAKTDGNFNKFLHTELPKDKLVVSDWVGGGCLLIRREVLEVMNQKMPELAPKIVGDRVVEYGKWFDHELGTGEDVAFCLRAKKCGFDSYLDLAMVCGHIGEAIYWHHNTGVNRPKRTQGNTIAPRLPNNVKSGVDSRVFARHNDPRVGLPVPPMQASKPALAAPPTHKPQAVVAPHQPQTPASEPVHVPRNPAHSALLKQSLEVVGADLEAAFR